MLSRIRQIFPLLRYRAAGGVSSTIAEESLNACARWLCRAQDATGVGGFARAYSLRQGWELPYPETTGYIIPTFLALDGRYVDLALEARAWRAGTWLADVQFQSGAICSRVYAPDNRVPSVFNTGMVLHGWLSLLARKADVRLLLAAEKAATWIVAEQENDGSWSRNSYNNIPHAYYTMVDWALLRYAQFAKHEPAREAAIKHLKWTLRQQRKNGWIDGCEFRKGDAVTTHTISYTTQGLVACARLLDEEIYVDAAMAVAKPLRDSFAREGKLAGTFDEDWRPTSKWECCTGNAQTSLMWQLLAQITGDGSWAEFARKLNLYMLRYQKVKTRFSQIDGAIPGSWPISGGYDSFNFPNHAAKFHIDALVGMI